MAQQTLVLDASVGVKWFSDKDEAALSSALALRDAHLSGQLQVMVPDLFYYEVINAIIHKKFIPTEAIKIAVHSLSALALNCVYVTDRILNASVELSRRLDITIYDSCYIAIARMFNCPLITANPKHHKQMAECIVIPVEKWNDK